MKPAAEVRRLELLVRRRVQGLVAGGYESAHLGPGSEAEELARYVPGHDVRRIDWNVTARAGDPHVWHTRAEQGLETWLLLDRTPSMAFGSGTAEKGETAERVAATWGLLAGGPGNQVGMGLLDTGGLRWVRPGSGSGAAAALIAAPAAARTGTAGVDLADAVAELGKRARRPGLRVIVTDLIEPSGAAERPFAWERPLRGLSARHDVIVVEVIDPRELALPDIGQVVFVDPETGRQREVATSDPRIRAAYAAAAATHRDATEAAVRACRADHLRVFPDDRWPNALARLLIRRRRTPARPARRSR